MSLTVLLTGFDRFPGAPFNPSGAIAIRLAKLRRPILADTNRIAHVFATRYAAIDRELPVLIARFRPDVVLMFGLAARTRHLRIETAARNAVSQLFPDAGGTVVSGATIVPGAPARLRGRAPFSALVAAARATGVAAAPSRDAGRYVCNYLYWRALESAARSCDPGSIVFIHVPVTRSPARPRRPSRRRRPALPTLVRAGAEILLVLTAAARARSRAQGSERD